MTCHSVSHLSSSVSVSDGFIYHKCKHSLSSQHTLLTLKCGNNNKHDTNTKTYLYRTSLYHLHKLWSTSDTQKRFIKSNVHALQETTAALLYSTYIYSSCNSMCVCACVSMYIWVCKCERKLCERGQCEMQCSY